MLLYSNNLHRSRGSKDISICREWKWEGKAAYSPYARHCQQRKRKKSSHVGGRLYRCSLGLHYFDANSTWRWRLKAAAAAAAVELIADTRPLRVRVICSSWELSIGVSRETAIWRMQGFDWEICLKELRISRSCQEDASLRRGRRLFGSTIKWYLGYQYTKPFLWEVSASNVNSSILLCYSITSIAPFVIENGGPYHPPDPP